MGRMRPMLATRGDRVPIGADWWHEVKWDGMRVLAEVRRGAGVRLTSRSESDVTASYPELESLAHLDRDLVVDGEVVAFEDGRPTFAALAERMHVADARKAARLAVARPVTYIVFDLLAYDGHDLTAMPLRERRGLLEPLLADVPSVHVPPTYDDGASLLAAAEENGLEGVVSKRVDSVYRPGRRSRDWLKFPLRATGSWVIGGYRFENAGTRRLGAVLLGQPGERGLEFRGRTGAGLSGRAGERLLEMLAPLRQDTSPFAEAVPPEDAVGAVWVRPEVVVDVEYLHLTHDGRLRQPAYRGIRSDLTPDELERT